jgi:type I restriction enzyme, S subunit
VLDRQDWDEQFKESARREKPSRRDLDGLGVGDARLKHRPPSASPLHTPTLATTLPREWDWARLDKVCLGIFDCPHSTPVLAAEGPYLARSQDIRSGVFRAEQAARVTEGTYQDRVGRAAPVHGDLLYSREGTYFGIAAEVPSGMRICLGQRMVLIRPDPRVLNFRLLRFWLNCPVLSEHIYGHRDGTVAERLNLPTIRGLPVPIPPLDEQQVIGTLLGTLDDKNDLNRRMNETLEAIAQSLFRSWFVDFDPVRAKQEGNHPPGLDAATAALFPDSFVDSPLGPIPKGWRSTTIGQVAGVNEAALGAGYPHEKIRYIDISSVSEGQLGDVTEHTLGEAPSRARRLVRHGDTIWSCVRPNRRSFLFIHRPAENLVVSTGFAVMTPKAVPPSFLYSWTTTSEFVDYLTANADGSAYPAVRADHFSCAGVLLAESRVLNRFEEIAGPLRDKIAANERQSRSLAALRDALLPKLLSGEIRVGDLATSVQ